MVYVYNKVVKGISLVANATNIYVILESNEVLRRDKFENRFTFWREWTL